MSVSLSFRVYGIPSRQGSKIPGVSSKTGKLFVREEAGEKLKTWRDNVRQTALDARGNLETFTGPIELAITFWVPRPPSVSPKKRPYPTVAPDLDKMIRAIGDALKDAGVYKNDAQVIVIAAQKLYADNTMNGSPGAWIGVQEIHYTSENA